LKRNIGNWIKYWTERKQKCSFYSIKVQKSSRREKTTKHEHSRAKTKSEIRKESFNQNSWN
jgi:hypothetical protein